eukprot:TRINITY_DN55511_c0_g1_i1.p1 TRINITY_DN55511_c0_g1~~TRINITY_DN55511_c0_g1_i1.p1  ORF type:complete len:476 (+),score=111.91 TRINITY_DN55511_c0_g1_i1:84-1430(+)
MLLQSRYAHCGTLHGSQGSALPPAAGGALKQLMLTRPAPPFAHHAAFMHAAATPRVAPAGPSRRGPGPAAAAAAPSAAQQANYGGGSRRIEVQDFRDWNHYRQTLLHLCELGAVHRPASCPVPRSRGDPLGDDSGEDTPAAPAQVPPAAPPAAAAAQQPPEHLRPPEAAAAVGPRLGGAAPPRASSAPRRRRAAPPGPAPGRAQDREASDPDSPRPPGDTAPPPPRAKSAAARRNATAVPESPGSPQSPPLSNYSYERLLEAAGGMLTELRKRSAQAEELRQEEEAECLLAAMPRRSDAPRMLRPTRQWPWARGGRDVVRHADFAVRLRGNNVPGDAPAKVRLVRRTRSDSDWRRVCLEPCLSIFRRPLPPDLSQCLKPHPSEAAAAAPAAAVAPDADVTAPSERIDRSSLDKPARESARCKAAARRAELMTRVAQVVTSGPQPPFRP